MKPFLVRIDENPQTVLESFHTEELLYEILRREGVDKNKPYRLKVDYPEPVHETIIGIGVDHIATIFIHTDSLKVLKEIACLS